MLALPFYQNAEANARNLLQQQMLSDAQRNLQESLSELYTIRSLLSQGHLCLCIPLHPIPCHQAQPYPPQPGQKTETANVTKETKLFVSLGSRDQQKKVSALQSDECKLKADCVEMVVNLSEVLPAEIFVAVEESSIRVEVNRVDREGVKNVWRHYDLPASVQVEAAKCILSHDGFLHISVPWCKMEL